MRVLIAARNRHIAFEHGRIVEATGPFDLVLDFPDADVRPGLINAHDHLHRNHFGRLGSPPYPDAYEWAADIQRRCAREIAHGRRKPRREALLAGAWKNLFAGVTSVVHHDPWEPDFEQEFPLRVVRIRSADSPGFRGARRLAPDAEPLAVHLAEGVSPRVAAEVGELEALGLLGPTLLAVHGVGMDSEGIGRFRSSGAALVWCPSSNLFLFGRTAARELLRDGVDVLLGSDSLLTGAGDLLDELRCARRLGLVDDVRLQAAVGTTAARRLGIAQPSLEPGAGADLFLCASPLLEADASDVRLVVAGGKVRVAHPELHAALRPLAGDGQSMTVGPVTRLTFADGRASVPNCNQGDVEMTPRSRTARFATAAAAAVLCLAASDPAAAQANPPQEPATSSAASPGEAEPAAVVEQVEGDEAAPPETDIFSADTLSILVDARLVAADGDASWVDRGFGKTRFSGSDDGGFRARLAPAEAFLIWQPRLSRSFSGNVSVGWQRDQEDPVDLMEAYATLLPERTGNTWFSAKAGLYWPEISLEHATGGAWSTVHTITPSAINSWVGEEVKVVGAEATLSQSFGKHEISATGGLFGYNDTSGTLLSFRGWALHDLKATAHGHFKLPPLNPFFTLAQENRTRSLLEIDDRVGFYGRVEYRPPAPVVVNAFYYDNRGDPEAFNSVLQWGWRTRFWNFGLSADVAPGMRLLAQAMTGTTLMGFETNGVIWVDTRFRSAFALLSHDIGEGAIAARAELFDTKERGSQMDHDAESEDGWALTAAGRWPLTENLTGLVEALHVSSRRGTRARLGSPARESQTLVQAALRFRW